MLATLKRFAKNDFVRNVGVLASGTIAGQAVIVLTLPLLTRLYEPAAFGLLSVYMSLLMLFSVAACLRLEIATPLPDDDGDAINLVILGVMSATLVGALLAFAVILVPQTIVTWIRQPEMEAYLWLVPVGVWFAAVFAAFQFWSVRKKRFAELARIQLVRACGGAGTQSALGFWNPTPFGLLFGHLLYTGLGTFSLARSLWRHDRALIPRVSAETLRRNLSAYRRFPLFSVPEALLNTATINLPVLMIAAFAGAEEAGFMLLAQRITGIPSGLLSASISRVYLAEAAEKRLKGELGKFTRQIMQTLFRLGIVPLILLGLLSPLVFPAIFGSDWSRAGIMVSWMTPFMILQFVVIPVATILHATGKQPLAMALQLFGFILMIGSIQVAAHLGSSNVFEVFVIAATIYYFSYLMVILRISSSAADHL